jgi:hypothetical protein
MTLPARLNYRRSLRVERRHRAHEQQAELIAELTDCAAIFEVLGVTGWKSSWIRVRRRDQ